MAVGADGYFTKPFSPTLLLKKVEEVLNPDKSDPCDGCGHSITPADKE